MVSRRQNASRLGSAGSIWKHLAGGVFLLTDAHQFIAGWFCFALAVLITLGVFWRF